MNHLLHFNSQAIENRKRVSAHQLSFLPPEIVVLVNAGFPMTKPGGLDQTYDFLPLPEAFWLTGSRRHGNVIAYSSETGWTEFAFPVSEAEIIWEGEPTFTYQKSRDQLAAWIAQNGFRSMIVIGQSIPEATLPLASTDWCDRVRHALDRSRRPKDLEEIELMRLSAEAAEAGYKKVASFLKPGITERQLQIEYEAETFRAGSHGTPYSTIIGSGVRSAILHGIPTEKKIQARELVLIDAGASRSDYCVDITRVFAADGELTTQQKDLFLAVKGAQMKCIAASTPGTEWLEVHALAARELANSLIDFSILNCSLDEALETEVISLFFPHGVGHMLGQRVRDVGGHKEGRAPRSKFGIRVRVDLSLEENFVMTVEPGLYFIPALLDLPANRKKYSQSVNWAEVEKWKSVGGIRIEDDIWIKGSGPVNLTEKISKIL
ncbi:MAG: M24 family metallopeptidase [Proteobacteria bacterium]|jgi:Xaa-Pro aminopeptidase|nr:M24 family metallopeptidase [Pseudomonadota bacterium]